MDVVTYALCKRFSKKYTDQVAQSLIEMSEGSGGGKMTVTDLIDAPVVGYASTIALNDDISNYDFIEIAVGVTAAGYSQRSYSIIPVKDALIPTNAFIVTCTGTDSSYIFVASYNLSFTANNVITVLGRGCKQWSQTETIFSIRGIKF